MINYGLSKLSLNNNVIVDIIIDMIQNFQVSKRNIHICKSDGLTVVWTITLAGRTAWLDWSQYNSGGKSNFQQIVAGVCDLQIGALGTERS